MATSFTTDDTRFTKAGTALTDIPTTLALNAWTSTNGLVTGYRPSDDATNLFIRDNTFALEGLKYFVDANKLKNAVTTALGLQDASGKQVDFLNGALTGTRYDAEADLEYIYPLAVWTAWQATGDTAWMSARLPALKKGLDYAFSDSYRYDPTSGLVKRAHTPGEWDFQFHIEHMFAEMTTGIWWNLLTTDAAGYFMAYDLMAEMYTVAGDTTSAATCRTKRDAIKTAADANLWNATQARYKLHKDIVLAEGQSVDVGLGTWNHTDAERWGVSENAYAIVRGLAQDKTAAAIASFKAWRASRVDGVGALDGTKLKYPWVIFDPPYPAGVYKSATLDMPPYVYANGNMAPFVGVKWAQALLRNGEAPLGWTLLSEAIDFFNSHNGTTKRMATWYKPDGSSTYPGFPIGGTELGDPWNLGPYLQCIVEDLCGIRSVGANFASAIIAPAFPSIGGHEGKTYTARAEFPGGGFAAYSLTFSADGLTVTGTVDSSGGLKLKVPGFPEITHSAGLRQVHMGPWSVYHRVGSEWQQVISHVKTNGVWN